MTTPKIVKTSELLLALLERVERLEDLARLNDPMMLFVVETEKTGYLVAAPNLQTVQTMIPDQTNIQYIGRASTQYTGYELIRTWLL